MFFPSASFDDQVHRHSFSTRALPVGFSNRRGNWEIIDPLFRRETREDDVSEIPGARKSLGQPCSWPLPEVAACGWMRRAASESGQMFVALPDGTSRLFFAGVGDPEGVLVQLLPRDAAPWVDFGEDAPACFCPVDVAKGILHRVYRGETSEKLSRHLNRLRSGSVETESSRHDAAPCLSRHEEPLFMGLEWGGDSETVSGSSVLTADLAASL